MCTVRVPAAGSVADLFHATHNEDDGTHISMCACVQVLFVLASIVVLCVYYDCSSASFQGHPGCQGGIWVRLQYARPGHAGSGVGHRWFSCEPNQTGPHEDLAGAGGLDWLQWNWSGHNAMVFGVVQTR